MLKGAFGGSIGQTGADQIEALPGVGVNSMVGTLARQSGFNLSPLPGLVTPAFTHSMDAFGTGMTGGIRPRRAPIVRWSWMGRKSWRKQPQTAVFWALDRSGSMTARRQPCNRSRARWPERPDRLPGLGV